VNLCHKLGGVLFLLHGALNSCVGKTVLFKFNVCQECEKVLHLCYRLMFALCSLS